MTASDLSPDLRARIDSTRREMGAGCPGSPSWHRGVAALEALARDLQEARRIAEEWREGYQATYPDLPRVPLPWEATPYSPDGSDAPIRDEPGDKAEAIARAARAYVAAQNCNGDDIGDAWGALIRAVEGK